MAFDPDVYVINPDGFGLPFNADAQRILGLIVSELRLTLDPSPVEIPVGRPGALDPVAHPDLLDTPALHHRAVVDRGSRGEPRDSLIDHPVDIAANGCLLGDADRIDPVRALARVTHEADLGVALVPHRPRPKGCGIEPRRQFLKGTQGSIFRLGRGLGLRLRLLADFRRCEFSAFHDELEVVHPHALARRVHHDHQTDLGLIRGKLNRGRQLLPVEVAHGPIHDGLPGSPVRAAHVFAFDHRTKVQLRPGGQALDVLEQHPVALVLDRILLPEPYAAVAGIRLIVSRLDPHRRRILKIRRIAVLDVPAPPDGRAFLPLLKRPVREAGRRTRRHRRKKQHRQNKRNPVAQRS